LAVLLVALLLSTVFVLRIPDTTAWQRVLQDSGHGPVFAALAAVLVWWQMRSAIAPGAAGQSAHSGDSIVYLRAFSAAVLLGITTELIQHFLPDRSMSLSDVVHDTAGAAVGISAIALLRQSGRERGIALAIGLIALTVLLWAPLRCARGYAERGAAWPDMVRSQSRAERYFMRAQAAELELSSLPAAYARQTSERAWQLRFRPGTHPAVELFEPMADWRAYRYLVLDLTNPGQSDMPLTLRILDRGHSWESADRFNGPIVVPAGRRVTVRVALAMVERAPRGRLMDLSHVANLLLFSALPASGETLYLSRIGLE
jgi:hypothetical protein